MAEAIAATDKRTAALPGADALFSFLDGLRRDGYRIDARNIAAAQCLLADANAEGADSAAARRIKFRLAPIIAKSASEQQDFYRRFDAWHREPATLRPRAPGNKSTTGPAIEAVKRDLRRWVIAGAVVVFLALAGSVTWYFWPPQETVVVEPPPPPTPPERGRAYDLPQERFTATRKRVSSLYDAARIAVAAAPLLALAAWLALRWRRRLLLLSRGFAQGGAELAGMPLPLTTSEVLFAGPELRASAHDLRKHRYLPTRELNAYRTVDATARQAGLFTPIYRERRQLPEYVFLIEENGANDHLARLFDVAIDRLRHEQVVIQRYYFHTDPRQLQADDRDRSIVSLAELAARTDDHRLFVIASADGFFHPLSGEVENWVQRLQPWQSRMMLSTRSLEQWTLAELRLLEEGFSLATAEASGFAAAGEKVAVGDDSAELLEGVLVAPEPARGPADIATSSYSKL
jgi:hypothetical protein